MKIVKEPMTTEMSERMNKFLEKDPESLKKKELAERNLVAAGIADKLEKSLKPKGFFNVPELLDNRRLEYAIPNGAFASYPTFDKCYVWQIPMDERTTYAEGGLIVRPDQIMAADRHTAPRGILISAGLQAMDSLYSTGVELGHIIRFKKLSPFVMQVDDIDGHKLYCMVVRDGDIDGSEDLAIAYHQKLVELKNVSDKGFDFRFGKQGEVTGHKVSPYYDASM